MKIEEMAFEPGKTKKFINPSRTKWIEKGGDEDLRAILPDLTKEEQTYLEYITSETYQKMVERLEQQLQTPADKLNLPSVLSLFMQCLREISMIEQDHKKELEELALKCVLALDEFEMVKEAYESGQVKFDIALGKPELEVPDIEAEEGLSEAEEANLELAHSLEDMTDSKLKRRFANLLIQGGSMLKMYLYKLVYKELEEVDSSLLGYYGLFAVAARLGYWTMPVQTGASEEQLAQSAGGSEQAVPEDEIYVIKARAICFPYLVYETAKGIYEWLSISDETAPAMADDTLKNEIDDTIVGPGVFQTIQKMVKNQKVLPLVLKKLIASSRSTVKEVLAGTPKGLQILQSIEREAAEDWEEYSREEEQEEND